MSSPEPLCGALACFSLMRFLVFYILANQFPNHRTAWTSKLEYSLIITHCYEVSSRQRSTLVGWDVKNETYGKTIWSQNGLPEPSSCFASQIWLWMKLVLRSVWEMQTILVGCSARWKAVVQENIGSSGDTGGEHPCVFLKIYSLKRK